MMSEQLDPDQTWRERLTHKDAAPNSSALHLCSLPLAALVHHCHELFLISSVQRSQAPLRCVWARPSSGRRWPRSNALAPAVCR